MEAFAQKCLIRPMKAFGRFKWSWRVFYFVLCQTPSRRWQERLGWTLINSGIVGRMCDEGYWKVSTLVATGEKYALPGKGGINSVIRWQQMHWPDPIKTECADKIAVRDYVRERIGEKHLIPMLPSEGTCWTDPGAIDFTRLPDRFVLKLNNGSGMNLVCRDKSALDIPKACKTMRQWMGSDFAADSREWHYRGISNRIYCEAFLETPDGSPPPDYKLICSDGKVLFAWVDTDRFTNHHRDIYDVSFNRLDVSIGYPPSGKTLPKPPNWEKMLEIARRLSRGIPIVRIDLYNIGGRIYFGEMTFSSDAGVACCTPFSFSREMAAKIDLFPFMGKKRAGSFHATGC